MYQRQSRSWGPGDDRSCKSKTYLYDYPRGFNDRPPWARVNAAAATARVRHELSKSGVEEEEETDGWARTVSSIMLVGQQVSVTETVCLHFGRSGREESSVD